MSRNILGTKKVNEIDQKPLLRTSTFTILYSTLTLNSMEIRNKDLNNFRRCLSAAFACLLLFHPIPIRSEVSQHEKILLRGADGNELTVDSKAPYSPKKTCGVCHDYDRITNGYHFQQGRTDGMGKIVISDTFDPKRPWNLSSGMYGRH